VEAKVLMEYDLNIEEFNQMRADGSGLVLKSTNENVTGSVAIGSEEWPSGDNAGPKFLVVTGDDEMVGSSYAWVCADGDGVFISLEPLTVGSIADGGMPIPANIIIQVPVDPEVPVIYGYKPSGVSVATQFFGGK
jgi:hypothetical protein